MAWSTVTATLLDAANTNVTFSLVTSDFPDAQLTAQSVIKNGGFWANSSASGVPDTFYPATSILYLTIS